MSTHRISVDIEEDDHKYLKMCCAKLGITIKDFVIKAVIEKVDHWEDKWNDEFLENGNKKDRKKKENK